MIRNLRIQIGSERLFSEKLQSSATGSKRGRLGHESCCAVDCTSSEYRLDIAAAIITNVAYHPLRPLRTKHITTTTHERKLFRNKQTQRFTQLIASTSVLGISGKSQILFAVVYLSRYLDLFTTFISVYNTFMKFVFVVSSLGTLYLMYLKFRATYDHNHDSFRIEFLLVPCVILALLINHDFTVLEVSVALCLSFN